eukprot:m.70860 g.70860  ORF g.70860 m.70860 type:complete len:353 (+) comp14102_c0_seq1:669-1727(+)
MSSLVTVGAYVASGIVALGAAGAGVLYAVDPDLHGTSSVRTACGHELASAPRTSSGPINCSDFYSTYHGHNDDLLADLVSKIRTEDPDRSIVFFAGDSSLDNKHWLSGRSATPCNGYEDYLSPGRVPADVCHWLNYELNGGGGSNAGRGRAVAVNTAVEESTLADRADGLLAQDQIIRDNLTEKDYIVVSVGGNDIALRPSLRTISNMLVLTSSPMWLLRRAKWAPGLAYFVDMFTNKIRAYVEQLTVKHKPSKVAVCMIYYPGLTPGGWADVTLRTLGYDKNPEKLQLVIRLLFEALSKRLALEDIEVIPVPLFDVLDPHDSSDYIQRVEPSSTGGHKMAQAFAKALGLTA